MIRTTDSLSLTTRRTRLGLSQHLHDHTVPLGLSSTRAGSHHRPRLPHLGRTGHHEHAFRLSPADRTGHEAGQPSRV